MKSNFFSGTQIVLVKFLKLNSKFNAESKYDPSVSSFLKSKTLKK